MDGKSWQEIGEDLELRSGDVSLSVTEIVDGGFQIDVAPRHDGQEVVVEAEPHGRWTRLHVTSKAVA